jgi:cardiolipin synthase
MEPTATARQPANGRRTGGRVPVLGPEAYLRVLEAAVAQIVPAEPERAVLVAMHGENAAVFRSRDGVLETWIGGPPEGIPVVAHAELEDTLAHVPATVEAVLAEHGIASRDVLFNTGECDGNPWPFVYVDLDARAAVFALTRPLGAPPAAPAGRIVDLTDPAAHIAWSHTVGVVQRPVSSLSRVIMMLANAARDTASPNWTFGLDDEPVPPLRGAPAMDLAAWEDELDELTGREATKGTVTPLIDGEAFFSRLEATLRGAEHSILLRMYIFDNDDYALHVADLLRERAAAGVDVRVLIDGLGTVFAGAAPPAGLPADHVPPPSIQKYLSRDSDLRVRTILNPFGTSDHTKTVVIDDEIAFLGGMNIGREYHYEWHDAMVELRGPVIAELADEFDFAWAGAGPWGDLGEFFERLSAGRTARSAEGYPVRVLYTSPTSSEIRDTQLAAIARSRSYVYLQNAYFSDDALLHALVLARRRGVDVRVVVPLQSDRGVLARNSVLAANLLFRHGVRVYIYPGMSHIKAAVYDGWACLGSANANHLSLRYNWEANIATSEPHAVRPLLEQLFEADFRVSYELTEELPTKWHDYVWEMIGDYAF